MNLLIVEDDNSVARFLSQAVVEAGYTSQIVGDGVEGLDLCMTGQFDLILLDVMLPGMDGFEICRRLRESGSAVPVLMLTARDSLEDKVHGLDSGADDYIVKPFQMPELLARTRALLRRVEPSPVVLTVGDLKLDPMTRRASRAEKEIRLSSTEYVLLEYLMRQAGKDVPRSDILEHVWQYEFEGNDNVLEVYISYLRGKIDKGYDMPLIRTVRGIGYRMEADVA